MHFYILCVLRINVGPNLKYLYIHRMTLSLTFSLSMKCSVSQFIARIKSRLYMQEQFLANILFEKNDILRRKIKNRPYSKANINRFMIRGYAMLLFKAKNCNHKLLKLMFMIYPFAVSLCHFIQDICFYVRCCPQRI